MSARSNSPTADWGGAELWCGVTNINKDRRLRVKTAPTVISKFRAQTPIILWDLVFLVLFFGISFFSFNQLCRPAGSGETLPMSETLIGSVSTVASNSLIAKT